MAVQATVDTERLMKLVRQLVEFARSDALISELTKDDIEYILQVGMDALSKDPSLLAIPGPIIVAGGLFGSLFHFIVRIFISLQ